MRTPWAEIIAHGLAINAERVGQGATPEEALKAALRAAIGQERASCAAVVRSWAGMAGRYGGESRLVEKIAEDVESDA